MDLFIPGRKTSPCFGESWGWRAWLIFSSCFFSGDVWSWGRGNGKWGKGWLVETAWVKARRSCGVGSLGGKQACLPSILILSISRGFQRKLRFHGCERARSEGEVGALELSATWRDSPPRGGAWWVGHSWGPKETMGPPSWHGLQHWARQWSQHPSKITMVPAHGWSHWQEVKPGWDVKDQGPPHGSGCQSCMMTPALPPDLLPAPRTKGPRSWKVTRKWEYLLMKDSRELMKVNG